MLGWDARCELRGWSEGTDLSNDGLGWVAKEPGDVVRDGSEDGHGCRMRRQGDRRRSRW